MKIITWNVNGWRSMLKHDHFVKLVEEHNPDIICLQETKLNSKTHIEFPNYKVYENTAERPGYSGTAILYKDSISFVKMKKNKTEGRTCMMEFDTFVLVNVYTPNSGEGLRRLDYRVNYWDKRFLEVLKDIKKPVVVVGDLNVARTEKDIKNAKSNERTAGYTKEERVSFEQLLTERGLKDVWREQNPQVDNKYTYWSNFHNARARNIGWRIDYVLTDKINVKRCTILDKVMGSDHAPIIFEI